MTIVDLQAEHAERLVQLFQRLPEQDLTFIKENVVPAAVAGWIERPGRRWVEVDDAGTILGFVAVLPLAGWSDHVGELRLVVDPAARGRGVGRTLAQHAQRSSLRAGLLKIVVELSAEQERTIEMFLGLGFTGEALLRDHFRDRAGDLQDLVMLAHFAEQTYDAMTLVGLEHAVEGGD